METRVIKSIMEINCPNCSKKIMVAIRMNSPMIEWALKPKDIEDAKEKLKEELKSVTFKSETDKKQVYSWIENDFTLFGPAEVPLLLTQIKEEQTGRESEK